MFELRHGTLTVENIGQFTRQLKLLLTDKLYTFVKVSEMSSMPHIRVNQYLDGRSVTPSSSQTFPAGSAENIHLTDADPMRDYAFITVCDTYGVFSINTGAKFSFHKKDYYAPERLEIEFSPNPGSTVVWVIYPTGDLVK